MNRVVRYGWPVCREMILEKRYVYHIVSGDVLRRIVFSGGVIFPRGKGYSNPLANADLVDRRCRFIVAGHFKLKDAVPFYLSPRQPMFCKLVREGKLKSDEIVALGFDFLELIKELRFDYALYTTNPVYPGAELLGGWCDRSMLNWNRLAAWRWNSDGEEKPVKIAKSATRQAEIDIACPIPLRYISHIVTDLCFPDVVADIKCDSIAVKGLHIW